MSDSTKGKTQYPPKSLSMFAFTDVQPLLYFLIHIIVDFKLKLYAIKLCLLIWGTVVTANDEIMAKYIVKNQLLRVSIN